MESQAKPDAGIRASPDGDDGRTAHRTPRPAPPGCDRTTATANLPGGAERPSPRSVPPAGHPASRAPPATPAWPTAQQRLADGDTAKDSRTLLGPFLTRWCDVGLGASKLKVTTRDNYTSVARTHLVPTLGHLRLDRLAASDVENLLVAKRQQGLSESTVRLIYTVLRRAWTTPCATDWSVVTPQPSWTGP